MKNAATAFWKLSKNGKDPWLDKIMKETFAFNGALPGGITKGSCGGMVWVQDVLHFTILRQVNV